jgi:trans-2,3-dihydro-3-hydroxyanthranilate isomerase
VLLAHLDGGAKEREVVLAENVGPVTCSVQPGSDGGSASFAIPRQPEKIGTAADVAKLAAAVSLNAADIGFGNFKPETWAAGNAFVFVPVRGLDATRRAWPDMTKWPQVFADDGPNGAYLYCGEVVDQVASYHARMFAPKMGITEDPATGSACAALGGYLGARDRTRDGTLRWVVEQGFEMGRPSLLHVETDKAAGKITAVRVGGRSVLVSEGFLEID